MTILNVIDANTGQLVSINTTSPAGSLYVLDANTGELVLLNLETATGTLSVIDAVTGEFVTLDYTDKTGIFHAIDSNTGNFIEIDLSNPSSTIYELNDSAGFAPIDYSILTAQEAITYHLNFDGADDNIVVPHVSSINNLPLGDFTVECSIDIDDSETFGYILSKENSDANGLEIVFDTENGSYVSITGDGYSGYVYFYFDMSVSLCHLEVDWTVATKQVKVFINGVSLSLIDDSSPYTTYDDDSAQDLVICKNPNYADTELKAKLQWMMFSNVVRHTSNFTPPSLTICPPADVNTVLRLAMDEGTGTLVSDTSGNNNNGTITGATWETD
jgi:hypothetical protein